ncbi:TraB/GumN family protein [Flavobacterium rhamnosiphilum]|uniref:TraB/GumN family protein n=1 Tax=Flavobacterium rhamnosiphilum TaxID=2541724 RepID=A0A4R5FA71_9FLAO|nr:TraB/GumN family protein [Flavobacterium rhamnosiphilum]TDE45596.1 TraB/GumN family protein [Flavobacterium rhamnosiphilum]
MKKLVSTLAVAAVLFISNITFAQEKTKESSLLWEVTGNGLAKPSYLFGTIHMICEKDFLLKEKVKKALLKSDQYIMEVNFDNEKEMKEMQLALMSDIPLSKKLTVEKFNELDSLLLSKYKISAKQFDNYSLAMLVSLVTVKSFECDNLKLYEMELLKLAKTQNKLIGGLETVKEQLECINKTMDEEDVLELLKNSNQYNQMTKVMVENYKSEKFEALYDAMTVEKFMSATDKKLMLDERNTNWVKNMPIMMKQKSTFYAVGAAHLAGDYGVVQLLKNAGFTVKPVMN